MLKHNDLKSRFELPLWLEATSEIYAWLKCRPYRLDNQGQHPECTEKENNLNPKIKKQVRFPPILSCDRILESSYWLSPQNHRKRLLVLILSIFGKIQQPSAHDSHMQLPMLPTRRCCIIYRKRSAGVLWH